jgi:hypothetical protein
MADQPYPGTDPVLQKINALLNDVINGVVIRAIEADIIAAQPWMGFPGWKQIWQFALEWLVSTAEDKGYKFISAKLTDAQQAAKSATAEAATGVLSQELSKPEDEQDAQRIQKELDDFDAAMGRLIVLPGAP